MCANLSTVSRLSGDASMIGYDHEDFRVTSKFAYYIQNYPSVMVQFK